MKHLSRMITAHNCFCSFIFNLVALVVSVLIIPIALLIMHFDKYIGILVTTTIPASVIILADYGPFNGITKKGFFIGMIINSSHTEDFMKDAIRADQISHFMQIAFPTIVSMIIYAIKFPNEADIQFPVITLTMILFSYSFTTVALMFLRNMLSNQVYTFLSFLLIMLISALNTGMLILCMHEKIKISFMIFFLTVLISSIMISISAFRYTTCHCLTNIKEN